MFSNNQIPTLIDQARHLVESPCPSFPVQVFHCRERQALHRVHFFQPTLMLVLRGTKQISGHSPKACQAGELILVSAGHEFPFANVPNDFYMALAIGFTAKDFPPQQIQDKSSGRLEVCDAPESLLVLLSQLMSLAGSNMPTEILESRRRELAQHLTSLELDTMLRLPCIDTWENKVMGLLMTDIAKDWNMKEVCSALATSESNLRRRLQAEGRGFRELLEDLRLTNGLGMIQTTQLPIGHIALACGYQSTSRFSERFKRRFHASPSELRKAH